MSNPKVIETINEDYVRKNKNKEQHPFVLSQKQKADNFHQEFLKNSAKNDQSLNKILEVHNNKMASLEGLIVGQISNQQDNIMKRLEERKIKNNRPKSQPPTAKNTEENGSHTPVFSKSNNNFNVFFLFQFKRKRRVTPIS